jgi:hypothetical protein
MKKILLLLITSLLAAQLFAQETSTEINMKEPIGISYNAREGVIIYPNPVTGDFFKVSGTKISSVELMNVIGKSVRILKNETENPEIVVKVSDLDKGMYLVKITFVDKKSVIKKLLIK